EWLAAQTADVAVAEIPLLYETGGEKRFDRVVVVTAPPEVREARRGAVADREDRLVPEEEKVRRADFCYVNDGSLEELDAFVAGGLGGQRRSWGAGSSRAPASSQGSAHAATRSRRDHPG